ncbi:hypothetical protein HMPREF0239_02737 [Clostridium sp. ATCC BAA-442]|nr:hypothetical protein HMPREF0239_02737 [Clostridium sp. ATCC BAA-442]
MSSSPWAENAPGRHAALGAPFCFYLLGGTEFRLRQGFALRAKRLYAPPGAWAFPPLSF